MTLFAELQNISVRACINVNESLIIRMESKALKSKYLSLSASADYRYASVVCLKNVGDSYTNKDATTLNQQK